MHPFTSRDHSLRRAELKRQFESCQALVRRAQDRAMRAAEETVALRAMLKSRGNGVGELEQADVWAAAARAITDMARERDRILGIVSHEMRQSLSAALAARHILAERGTDAVAVKAADVLDRQLGHLTKLVELLLDYSRLMVGTATIETKRVDVREIVRETVDAYESTAQSEHIELSISCPDAPQAITGDGTRLRQLVSNLLHNAIRYTPAGGRVRCATLTRDGAVHIVVTDSGAGIAADDVERIFEPFTRAATGGRGLGVGLAIAQRIAHLHGGSITASSDGLGRGSTFTVVLPLSSPAA